MSCIGWKIMNASSRIVELLLIWHARVPQIRHLFWNKGVDGHPLTGHKYAPTNSNS